MMGIDSDLELLAFAFVEVSLLHRLEKDIGVVV
jgi:hypothetical protein